MAGYVREKIRAQKAAQPHTMQSQARARLAQLRAATAPPRNPLAALGTMDLIVHLRPDYRRPVALAPMVSKLEESWTRPVRCTIHAPPQHKKTTTIEFWIVATLLRDPSHRFAYLSFNAGIAEEKGGEVRKIARAAGLVLSEDTDAKGSWSTPQGGGLYCAGVEQGLTGRPADTIIVDDPYKDRKHARSKAWQRVIRDFWLDVVDTRARASVSIFVQHTRWAPKDLTGQIMDGSLAASEAVEYRFDHICLSAENDNGEPLDPVDWPRELLATKKSVPLVWWSLWMGKPRPEGSEIFRNEIVPYRGPVPVGCAVAGGLDFAYTAKTSSDSSTAWVMHRDGRGETARYFIDRQRLNEQLTAPMFAAKFRKFKTAWPTARWRAYVSGTERGAGDYLNAPTSSGGAELGVEMRAATADKMIRALPLSAAWNDGRVLVPDDAPWATDLLEKLAAFTGAGGDEDDDDIDALAAAFDVLAESSDISITSGPRPDRGYGEAPATRAVGGRRWTRDLPGG